MKRRNVLNSPRLNELKKKRQKVLRRKFLFFIFGILVIITGLSYLSRIPRLGINNVEVVGNKIIDEKIIKEAVQAEIAGNYLWIIPKTNIFFYPKNKIEDILALKFKRLKDISLSIQNRQTLEISLTEREAKYTWCGATLPDTETNNEKCYFLDEDGYIFDEAPYFSGEVYFKFYGVGDVGTYFSQTNFKELITFKNALTTSGMKPVGLTILTDGDIKMLLSASGTIKPEVIFNTTSDFQKITENLQSALSTEPLQSNFKNKYSSLEYIDLRFGNKVYYKFK